MNDVEKVLTSVVQGVMGIQDPTSQRCCYCILRKLMEAWGMCCSMWFGRLAKLTCGLVG